MLAERVIAYGFVIPFASVAIGTARHLGTPGTIALDLALSAAMEAVFLKSVAALIVAAKSLPLAVPLAYLLPIVLPTPGRPAAILAAAVLASDLAGVVAFAIRHHRRPPHYGGTRWRRPGLALYAAIAAVALGVTAAGAALTGPASWAVALAAVGALVWWAAYALQSSPRRGVSRAWALVLTQARDLTTTAGAR